MAASIGLGSQRWREDDGTVTLDAKLGGVARTVQSHNALHWRTWKLADVRGSTPGAAAAPDGALDQARLMYWGPDWRLLEERVDDGLSAPAWSGGTWDPDADPDRTEQYAWGLRYIDDIVLHRRDANMDGGYADPGAGDGTWFHLTDAQFSGVCLVTPQAAVAERVSYSAYGTARHRWPGDVDGDGAVTTPGSGTDAGIASAIASAALADRSIGGSAYRAEADLDRDGVVNSADVAAVGSALAALPAGQLSSVDVASGAADSAVGWDGYLCSPECALYEARFRVYEPGLGRWLERDPAGYADSASLYEFVRNAPVSATDPRGLLLHVFAFEGLSGHPTEDPIRFSHNWVGDYWQKEVGRIPDSVWHYYSEADRGVRRAVEEATAIAKAPAPSAPAGLCFHTIAVLGYSNGGRAAVQFAEAMRDRGIAVDLGFTADPIPKGLELVPPFIFFPDLFLAKPANVDWWENYYQRTDLILKGNRVVGADHEEQFFDLGAHGHVEIPMDKRVRDHLSDALSCLPPWRADWRWP